VVLAGGANPDDGAALETDRLLLRPWRAVEASVLRELWAERDPRVPTHRRLDVDGHPTVDELADRIRDEEPASVTLLAVEQKDTAEVIGYCGLIDSGRGAVGEPELAFELLRRVWGRGYATEASLSVLDWARRSGHRRLWATVWDWNTASRRVLEKAGFVETGRVETPDAEGVNILACTCL
jgi:ribosomal-protein-alanine N-acetyltransferase